jgi:hypothetical protein
MQTRNSIRLAASVATAATVLTQATLNAQTWETVDDFQYPQGTNSGACALAGDAQGNLYAAGYGVDASNVRHALVMRSGDQGATWSTLQDYTYRPPTSTEFDGFCVDAAHNLYAVGSGSGQVFSHWLVRKSADGGATWTTADDYQLTSGLQAGANGCAADAAGNVYVIGSGEKTVTSRNGSTSQIWDWLVRKSSDAGATWTIVDQYEYPKTDASLPTDIIVTPAGLFVAGWIDGFHWIIRKSANGGLTWTTVSDYYPGSGFPSLTADSAGNIYAGGMTTVTKGTTHWYWTVRKGVSGGTSWATVDSFEYVPNQSGLHNSVGRHSMGVDVHGNVYAAGYGTDAAGVTHWLVRASGNQGASWSMVDDFQYASGSSSAANCFGGDAVGNIYTGGSGADLATGTHWLVRKTTP